MNEQEIREKAEIWVKENMDCCRSENCAGKDIPYFSDEERACAKSAYIDGATEIMNISQEQNKFFEAFISMCWYHCYDETKPEMIKKIEDKDYDYNIPYDDENGFSTEVWSIFVLMFGEYGVSPRYGWIDHITEFKDFLKKILKELKKKDPESD